MERACGEVQRRMGRLQQQQQVGPSIPPSPFAFLENLPALCSNSFILSIFNHVFISCNIIIISQ